MKTTLNRSPIKRRRQSYWRLLWAVVFLLHAPITIKAFGNFLGPEEGRTAWSSILLLTLSNVFFICEIAFAYSLRILSDRRRLVAFLVVIALLHVGVLERGLPQTMPNADLNYWLLTATISVVCIRTLMQFGMAFWRQATGHAVEQRRQLARWWYALRAAPARAPVSPQAVRRFTPPRAPPAFCV